ncbi:MAG: V4R domain-containing protein [Candidatus Freyarchaeota archaeon]
MDQTLGSLYDGLPMMFSADSATTYDAQRLGSLIALKILERGGGCILAHENLPFSLALGGILHFTSPEKKLALQKAVSEGRLYYFDVVLEETVNIKESEHSEFVKPVENDLNRIVYEVLNAKSQIKKDFSDAPVLILQANISSLAVDFDPGSILKMVRKLILSVKRSGDLFLGILNRELHEQKVVYSLTHLADYVLEFGIDVFSGKKQPYVSVTRVPSPNGVKRFYGKSAYQIIRDDFHTLPSLPSSFEELKENIFYTEMGDVITYDTNYVIAEMHNFVHLLKEVEEKLGKGEYTRTIKNVGSLIGSQIAKSLSCRFQTSDEELFKSAVEYLSATGWGKLKVLEGNVKSGKIRVECFSVLAANYGESDYPVCVLEGGILQGIIDELTSTHWTCEETKCIAKGDKKCRFELKLEE